MAKSSNKIKFLEVNPLGDYGLEFSLGDGQTIAIRFGEFSEDVRHRAMVHGFNQKIRDASASFGKERDYDGAFEEMMKVVDGLKAGSWNRQGGGIGAGVIMEDLAAAISRIKSVDIAKAMAAVKSASDEQRKAWSKNARVAQLMAENKAARLAKAASAATDDLDITFEDEEADGDLPADDAADAE